MERDGRIGSEGAKRVLKQEELETFHIPWFLCYILFQWHRCDIKCGIQAGITTGLKKKSILMLNTFKQNLHDIIETMFLVMISNIGQLCCV